MANSLFVYPYRAGSRSAVALAQHIQARMIRLTNSRFNPTAGKTVINWGSTNMPDSISQVCQVRNDPTALRNASNKRIFFQTIAASPEETRARTPDWTTTKSVAAEWLSAERPSRVFARTVLAGHSGEGIVELETLEDLAPIPEGTLLVKYVMKRDEFRIHLGDRGETIISEQQKRRSMEVPDDQVNFRIRNHSNGFIFARNNLEVPADVLEQARRALAATGLEFGAVDVLWNQRSEEAYVLEVNTAPGLEGSTVEDYANYFNRR